MTDKPETPTELQHVPGFQRRPWTTIVRNSKELADRINECEHLIMIDYDHTLRTVKTVLSGEDQSLIIAALRAYKPTQTSVGQIRKG